jgi:hypothetical protein
MPGRLDTDPRKAHYRFTGPYTKRGREPLDYGSHGKQWPEAEEAYVVLKKFVPTQPYTCQTECILCRPLNRTSSTRLICEFQ